MATYVEQGNNEEWENLRSQIVTSSFQDGVAMLSGVLNSDRAIAVNIAIMRTFTQLRSLLSGNESLSERMAKLEKGTDKLFRIVFERLDTSEAETLTLPNTRRRIGLKS